MAWACPKQDLTRSGASADWRVARAQPARRCRHTPAKCTRLPVPPFGQVRENGEAEQTPSQVTSRSHGAMIACRASKIVIRRVPFASIRCRLGIVAIAAPFLYKPKRWVTLPQMGGDPWRGE